MRGNTAASGSPPLEPGSRCLGCLDVSKPVLDGGGDLDDLDLDLDLDDLDLDRFLPLLLLDVASMRRGMLDVLDNDDATRRA